MENPRGVWGRSERDHRRRVFEVAEHGVKRGADFFARSGMVASRVEVTIGCSVGL